MNTKQLPSTEALNFFNQAEKTLAFLAGRWSDEKDHEDVADYTIPLKPIAEKNNVTVLKMVKKPFGCVFSVLDGREYQIKVTARQYSYIRTK